MILDVEIYDGWTKFDCPKNSTGNVDQRSTLPNIEVIYDDRSN